MAERMASGRMDRQIVLQLADRGQDGDGGELLIWPPDGGTEQTLYAEWLPAGTTEVFRAQQRLQSYVEGIFRIHWRDDVTPEASRILWDGRTFDLKPAIEIGRRRGLEIPVTAHGERE